MALANISFTNLRIGRENDPINFRIKFVVFKSHDFVKIGKKNAKSVLVMASH